MTVIAELDNLIIKNPKLGEVRSAKELGYKHHHKLLWCACPSCGKERWVTLLIGSPKWEQCLSCSHRGHKATLWKGGKSRTANGYILIWLSPDDFFYPMINGTGYILEHRLVMARHLGRCLLPWEVVHHRNGIKDDNHIENLQLLPSPKYHIVDSVTKRHIKQLENKVDKLLEGQRELKTEIRLLRFENKELRENHVSY